MYSKNMFSLEGKTALVTGASYGIGFAIACAFAAAGAKIVFNDINRELVEKGLASYREKGITARCRALSRSLVSKSVESLIQCGYLDGEPDSRDRRYFHLKLTEKAEQVLREMQKIRSNFWSMLQEGVTPEEMEQFLRVLGKMRHNLEKILPQGQE